jgi:hypothetical protein
MVAKSRRLTREVVSEDRQLSFHAKKEEGEEQDVEEETDEPFTSIQCTFLPFSFLSYYSSPWLSLNGTAL